MVKVHASEPVDTKQRRDLYCVNIGGEGAGLSRRIENLDARIRAKALRIRDATHDPP